MSIQGKMKFTSFQELSIDLEDSDPLLGYLFGLTKPSDPCILFQDRSHGCEMSLTTGCTTTLMTELGEKEPNV